MAKLVHAQFKAVFILGVTWVWRRQQQELAVRRNVDQQKLRSDSSTLSARPRFVSDQHFQLLIGEMVKGNVPLNATETLVSIIRKRNDVYGAPFVSIKIL